MPHHEVPLRCVKPCGGGFQRRGLRDFVREGPRRAAKPCGMIFGAKGPLGREGPRSLAAVFFYHEDARMSTKPCGGVFYHEVARMSTKPCGGGFYHEEARSLADEWLTTKEYEDARSLAAEHMVKGPRVTVWCLPFRQLVNQGVRLLASHARVYTAIAHLAVIRHFSRRAGGGRGVTANSVGYRNRWSFATNPGCFLRA